MRNRVALHFPRWAKLVLYCTLLLSLGTGVGWYVLERWFQIDGEFGMEKHPWQPWLIKLHGASAFICLIGFGYLLASHIHVGLRSRRNRFFGIAMTGDFTLQIVSGYGLYYAAPDLRELVSTVHLISGIALPVLLILHIVVGHRSRKARQSAQA